MGLVADRDRPLLHRLEQRALGARGRAVDLVGQDQRAEERAGLEHELRRAVGPVDEHDGARDVGGHQVGRELDAVVRDPERACEGAHHARLADSRHAFEQGVATEDEADHDAPDGLALADDGAADLRLDRRHGLAELGGCGLGGRSIRGRDRRRLAHREVSSGVMNFTFSSAYQRGGLARSARAVSVPWRCASIREARPASCGKVRAGLVSVLAWARRRQGRRDRHGPRHR